MPPWADQAVPRAKPLILWIWWEASAVARCRCHWRCCATWPLLVPCDDATTPCVLHPVCRACCVLCACAVRALRVLCRDALKSFTPRQLRLMFCLTPYHRPMSYGEQVRMAQGVDACGGGGVHCRTAAQHRFPMLKSPWHKVAPGGHHHQQHQQQQPQQQQLQGHGLVMGWRETKSVPPDLTLKS